MSKKISVIVPVYNSAPYLEFCVASVLKQSWTDFELLLITDGPTDGSEELCREFALRDQRIRFLPQAHRGVSAARNVGLEQAEGAYFFFLDSDDAIHPRLLERLLEVAEETGAAVVAEGLLGWPSREFEEMASRLSRSGGECFGGNHTVLSSQEAVGRLLMKRTKEHMYAMGGKLIQASAARTARFDENIISGEDTKYIYQILKGGTGAAILEGDGYYYRERQESLSRSKTVETCKSLYESYRYIGLREEAEGRGQCLHKWEEDILWFIMSYHVDAHKKNDLALIKYTIELREENKEILKKGQIDWKIKLGYYLAFACYPAYEFCYTLYRFWQDIRGRK